MARRELRGALPAIAARSPFAVLLQAAAGAVLRGLAAARRHLPRAAPVPRLAGCGPRLLVAVGIPVRFLRVQLRLGIVDQATRPGDQSVTRGAALHWLVAVLDRVTVVVKLVLFLRHDSPSSTCGPGRDCRRPFRGIIGQARRAGYWRRCRGSVGRAVTWTSRQLPGIPPVPRAIHPLTPPSR